MTRGPAHGADGTDRSTTRLAGLHIGRLRDGKMCILDKCVTRGNDVNFGQVHNATVQHEIQLQTDKRKRTQDTIDSGQTAVAGGGDVECLGTGSAG
jgi:hypothetical protein